VTIEQYMADVARTMRPGVEVDHITEGVLGLTSEAGEVADLVLKGKWGQLIPVDKLVDELGDVLFYLTQLGISCGYTLHGLMERNVAKRQKRYPNGWSLTGSYHD
jgi:NTP pyrophosphatase (non-canonical NTP hydrolase)